MPQESLLSPVLFSIFMDGLKDWIMHTNSIMSGEAKNRVKAAFKFNII